MSHASGRVYLNDGTAFWFEYNGTSDIYMPRLYMSQDALHESWRKDQSFDRCCSCCSGHHHELAIIESHYGGGDYVPGVVCRECMMIQSPRSAEDVWNLETIGCYRGNGDDSA